MINPRYTNRKISRRKTVRRGGGFFGRSSSKSKTSSRSIGLSNMKVSFSLSYDQVKNGYVISKNALMRGPDGKNRKDNTFIIKRFRDFIAFQKDFEKCMNKSKSIWRGIRISNVFRRMNFLNLNTNTDEKKRNFTIDIVSWVQSVISCYQKLEKFMTFRTHRNVSSSKTKSNIVSEIDEVNLAKRFRIVYDPKRTTNENKELYLLHYTGPGNLSVYREYSDIDKMRKKIEKQFNTIKVYWKRVTKQGRVKTQRMVKYESTHARAERMDKLRNIGIALEKWLKAVMKIKYIVIDTFTTNNRTKA